jgi:BirA family biotin operon repressor/biotin-[acetyl-CoA-carboxylase] ligase
MDQSTLQTLLSDLPLGGVRYFATVGSTNDLALRWAEAGAPDLSLVAADEQTAGRGRLERRWFTPPEAALAFSLILRPGEGQDATPPYHYTALGALAVCDALNAALPPMLPAQIKWPNDVIATRKKLAGVLAEACWHGEQLSAVVVGIGINVAPSSVPPEEQLNYPATSVEAVVEAEVDRWGLLHAVLDKLLYWRERLGSQEFLAAWGARLAFRGEWVQATFEEKPPLEGQVLGLTTEGRLCLRDRQGELHELTGGELNVRPVGRN